MTGENGGKSGDYGRSHDLPYRSITDVSVVFLNVVRALRLRRLSTSVCEIVDGLVPGVGLEPVPERVFLNRDIDYCMDYGV